MGEINVKKWLATLFVMTIFILGIVSMPVYAANGNVKIDLPAFKVTLNGTAIKNDTNQLSEFIVYHISIII